MISIDLTLVYQIIGFFILLVILNGVLYGPVRRILKERDERINGTIKSAAATDKEIADGLVSYDRKLKEAAVKGNEERSRIRQAGIDAEKELMEATRRDVAAEMSKMKAELDASRKQAYDGLKAEAKTLSAEIASKVLDRRVITVLVACVLPLIPAIAGASTEGGSHGSSSATTWKIINFVILAIGVYLAWTKGISKMLSGRGAEIKKALDEANALKDAAEKKAAEYKQKLSTLEGRIAEIHNELKLEGEAEKARIIEEAGKAAVKVREQARQAAEQEVKKAKIELRKEAAELAVTLAEELLKKELKPDDQEKLVKGYLERLRLN